MEYREFLISFVLAIYNVEEYLEECIDSIITFKGNYEVLLIDDGSKDKSGLICDRYAGQNSNVKVFHKQNGGLSDARNYGLLRSKGKYVFFIDSDDVLPEGCVSKLLKIADNTNSDVVVWDCLVIDGEKREIEYGGGKYIHPALRNNSVYSASDFLLSQIEGENDFARTVWLGMYNRKFLIENCLWFEKGMLHEDELWTPKVYIKANEIYYIGEPLYCYRIRQNSIMNKADQDYSRNLKSLIYIYNELLIYYDYAVTDNLLRGSMKADIAKRYLYSIARYEAYNYPEISQNIKRIEIWKNSKGIKDKTRAVMLLINIKFYCKINNFLKHKSFDRIGVIE